MRRTVAHTLLALSTAILAGLAFTGPARAGTSLDIGLHIGDAPPPPAFVFEDEPEVVLIPQTRVYYVPGPSFDLFRYGRYWYINNGGWWYRAYNYRGPFGYIEYDKVPTTILRVPKKYHHHPLGGPPGQTGMHPGRGNAYGLERGMNLDRKTWQPEKQPAKPQKKEWKRDK
jgi:hypothetical protein